LVTLDRQTISLARPRPDVDTATTLPSNQPVIPGISDPSEALATPAATIGLLVTSVMAGVCQVTTTAAT